MTDERRRHRLPPGNKGGPIQEYEGNTRRLPRNPRLNSGKPNPLPPGRKGGSPTKGGKPGSPTKGGKPGSPTKGGRPGALTKGGKPGALTKGGKIPAGLLGAAGKALMPIQVGAMIGQWMQDNLEPGTNTSGRGAGRAAFNPKDNKPNNPTKPGGNHDGTPRPTKTVKKVNYPTATQTKAART